MGAFFEMLVGRVMLAAAWLGPGPLIVLFIVAIAVEVWLRRLKSGDPDPRQSGDRDPPRWRRPAGALLGVVQVLTVTGTRTWVTARSQRNCWLVWSWQQRQLRSLRPGATRPNRWLISVGFERGSQLVIPHA